MLNATISTYGGPYSDSEPVEDPTTQIASDNFNRMLEDHAQMTRETMRAWVSFLTDTDPVLPKIIPVTDATSVWGDGSAQHPVITKMNHGIYQIAYAVSYTDELNFVENVSFRFGGANIAVGGLFSYGTVRVVIDTANTLTVYVFNTAWTPSDLDGGVPIQVWLR